MTQVQYNQMKKQQAAKAQQNKKKFPSGGRQLLGFADLTAWQAARDAKTGLITRKNGDVVINEAKVTAGGHVHCEWNDVTLIPLL